MRRLGGAGGGAGGGPLVLSSEQWLLWGLVVALEDASMMATLKVWAGWHGGADARHFGPYAACVTPKASSTEALEAGDRSGD